MVHALRGLPSNNKVSEKTHAEAISILSEPVYRGFGPTLASEYLQKRHKLTVSKETVRKWMAAAGLWRQRKRRVGADHAWRPRRSCLGELVQWDTSEHDWLEGRGEKLYLISMIDDATSRLFARFAPHDSTEENMRVMREYLERNGRPMAFYTDKAGLFQTAPKTKRGEQRGARDQPEMPPTQIGRALRELQIQWIAAHSPQAKGRVERQFGTAQDRLVKGMRVEGVCTMEQANAYLDSDYLPWWEQTLTVIPASPNNAHRPLGKEHNLAASLSRVDQRQVTNDYTVRYDGKLYQIDRKQIRTGMRGSSVRVEQRLDGSIAMRFQNRYLTVKLCQPAPKVATRPATAKPHTQHHKRTGSDWNKNFDLRKGPKIWQAAQSSGAKPMDSKS